MPKWTLKTYLERALATRRAEGNRQGMMVLLNGKEMRLLEVHADFLLVMGDDEEMTAVPMHAVREITVATRLIGAGKKTKSGASLDEPDTKEPTREVPPPRPPLRPVRPSAS